MQKRKLGYAAAIAALSAGACSPAFAQTAENDGASAADSGGVPEIVITATRRSATLQEVPLSITAVTAETLEATAATNFIDYAGQAPNLAFGATGEGVSGNRTIAIRGVGDANTTGFYIDDTPLPESLDPRVVGIERIEILRGPQGTLYGARSMGGTVRLITVQPDTDAFAGEGHVSGSQTNKAGFNFQVDGAVNVPVATDVAAFRLGGFVSRDSGFMEREYDAPGGAPGDTVTVDNVGEVKSHGLQAALRLEPTAGLSITPRILYQRTESNGFPFADLAVVPGEPSVLQPESLTQRRQFDIQEGGRDRWILGSVDARYDVGVGELISSTSLFDRSIEDREDYSSYLPSLVPFPFPAVPGLAIVQRDVEQFTQELRFSSDFAGPLQLIAGAYFSNQLDIRRIPPTYQSTLLLLGSPTDLVIDSTLRIRSKEFAGFGEISYDITDRLRATAGLRAFETRISASQDAIGAAVNGSASFPKTTNKESGINPKFNIRYQFDRDNQIYANVAKGFRPGGVNGLVPTAFGCDADLAALGLTQEDTKFFGSDSLWSYEVGAKVMALDRRLVLSGAAFEIRWNDLQQRVSLPCGFTFRSNNGKARSRGFELEMTARPTDGLTLSGGAGYTDAQFTDSPAGAQFSEGDRVPQVPHWTATASADYSADIGEDRRLFAHASYRYVGSSVSDTNAGTDPVTGKLVTRIRPSYSLIDARFGVSFGNYELALFGKNLTDERASLSDSQSIAAETVGLARIVVNQPRTLGVELRARF